MSEGFDPAWAGTDEVGRGCLAGPVVAAAVAWTTAGPPACAGRLRDSKRLSPDVRTELAVALAAPGAVRWAVAWADSTEIDRVNILRASIQAMVRSLGQLGEIPGVYVDGNQPLPIDRPQETVVGGDDAVPQIAAASILAKVFRDRWMACLDARYPGYDWAANKGYGTAEHRAALARLGPSPQHRRSFGPVNQLSLFAAP